ncbi:hypothetical protein G9A89_020210 [Geosiphon pyriformis]|nr:hypothetical protein G9A89_020210 [Geosiphon pyriformis]
MNQLGCQVDCAASTRIITANGATKTPISEIDDFLFEINSIIAPIKVLVMEAIQYQAQHTCVPAMCSHFWINTTSTPLIEFKEEKKNLSEKPIKSYEPMASTMNYHLYFHETTRKRENKKRNLPKMTIKNYGLTTIRTKEETKKEKEKRKKEEPAPAITTTYTPYTYTPPQPSNYCQLKLVCINCDKKLLSISVCCDKNEKYPMAIKFYCHPSSAKVEGTTFSKLLEIKNNLLSLSEFEYIPTFDVFGNVENNPKKFHKHYQHLALTREKQEQCLEEINTQLCDYCLIPCNFQYCNECDLIYNLLSHIIYTIPEKEKLISSCILESESPFNLNSNSDNDDNKNNGSSSIQNGNKNNSNLNSNLNLEQYIMLFDLTKKQELKWFSNNNEGIMPEHMHNTNAKFDLRYPRKNAIKLELHLCTSIDFKIALEIPATIMIQLASRSSLVEKKINIREGIIDAKYVGNIITILQNDSEKIYIIEPNKKIAQAIFLPLVKIAQLVLVEKREKLRITARKISEFGSMSRIDVPVNITEKEMRKMLSTPTRTIGTDKLRKFRSTTTYTA